MVSETHGRDDVGVRLVIRHKSSAYQKRWNYLMSSQLSFLLFLAFFISVFVSVHGDTPTYLSDRVCPYKSARALHSANNNLLTVVHMDRST